MKSYDIFLEYYDEIVRNTNNPIEEELDFLVNDCIKKYLPKSKTILELACWTWIVAKELINLWYDVVWIDINEKILKIAEKNIPKEKLVLWDMTDFDLGREFDVVLCNYNSICHLLTWEEWQKFFCMSFKHLKKDWILVFDINTLYEFESITKDYAQFFNFWDDTVCLEMRKIPHPYPLLRGEGEKGFIYEWIVKIFKKREDWKYDLIEENVRENSFEINKIKKELKNKWFEILDLVDYHYWEVNTESERVYFICKKK